MGMPDILLARRLSFEPSANPTQVPLGAVRHVRHWLAQPLRPGGLGPGGAAGLRHSDTRNPGMIRTKRNKKTTNQAQRRRVEYKASSDVQADVLVCDDLDDTS